MLRSSPAKKSSLDDCIKREVISVPNEILKKQMARPENLCKLLASWPWRVWGFHTHLCDLEGSFGSTLTFDVQTFVVLLSTRLSWNNQESIGSNTFTWSVMKLCQGTKSLSQECQVIQKLCRIRSPWFQGCFALCNWRIAAVNLNVIYKFLRRIFSQF